MMQAKPGSQLAKDAWLVLGHAPGVSTGADGRTHFDAQDLAQLKRVLIYPKLRKQITATKAAARDMRGWLEETVAQARQAGIMLFQAAGNSYRSTAAAGDPAMSTGTTEAKGIFLVGGVDPKGPGMADDAIYADSSEGAISGAAPAVGVPTGTDPNGPTTVVDGTSFATPLMVEAAFTIAAINPALSFEQIEAILTDPRVAHDVAGTTRDGAGSVDFLAAFLLAKDPTLSRVQIEQIRAALDAHPDQPYVPD
jgi:hypothetical protein